jgi:hypothetical protein
MWWFFGIPFGTLIAPVFLSLSVPSVTMLAGMLVMLAGMALVARRALNY